MEKKAKLEKYKFHVIIAIMLIIYGISIAPKELQNDTFYTIKVGEYITQNGIGNLKEDPFSWHELPYTFPHWLYDISIYGIYHVGGMLGIYISTIVLTCILSLAIYFTSNKISKNAPISAIITFIAMYLMQPYLAARAQLVTFSFMVLTIYLIEKFLEKGEKKYAIALILDSLLIVNLHMAVWPFFFVIFLPYFFEYVVSCNIFTVDLIIKLKIFWEKYKGKEGYQERISELEKKIQENKIKRSELQKNPYKIKVTRNDNVKKLFLVVVICACMGIFTPTGPTTPYTYLYKTMSGNTMQVINEHMPLDLQANKDFVAFFIMFIVVLTFIDIKIDLKHLCYYLGILYLALKARRQVSMFLVICTPILCKLITEIFEKYSPKLQDKIISIVNNFYSKVVLITVIIIIGIQNFKTKINLKYYNNANYPIYASEWIKQNLDYKNIKLFNEYNYGSYLLFEGIPIMIDSRCDLYTPQYNTKTGNPKDGEDIFMDVQNVATGEAKYEEIFEKYGVTHVITYSDSSLSKKLKTDLKYKKIYPTTEEEKEQDNRFVIYERINDDNEENTIDTK